MSETKELNFRVRPSYVLRLDDVIAQVDYMLDVLEARCNPTQYQNCVTVLDHLVACDDTIYGRMNTNREGVDLDED